MRQCAVCGINKNKNEFGDGIICPKTTCLACFKKAKAKAKSEKNGTKSPEELPIDPGNEFVRELKRREENVKTDSQALR